MTDICEALKFTFYLKDALGNIIRAFKIRLELKIGLTVLGPDLKLKIGLLLNVAMDKACLNINLKLSSNYDPISLKKALMSLE